MPTICMFYGIGIRMFIDDRNPPHFRASHQGCNATFNFTGDLLEGEMPARQTKMIAAWAEIHSEELAANWELALEKEALFRINPLQ